MKKILSISILAILIILTSCCACRKAQTIKPIAGTSWSLIELGGSVIDRGSDPDRFSLVIGTDGRISGKGDCNRYFGEYTIEKDNKIKFGRVGSTMMFCPDQDAENKFFAIFNEADRYKMDGDFLMLMKGETVLASFKIAPKVDNLQIE